MSNQLTPVQSNYATLQQSKGFDAFVKLFELAGNDPEQARNLAEKEAYHLAQIMADSEDLRNTPPASLMMEMRKIPLHGVTLDPALKLAYLTVQDKAKGKVTLEVSGRGKAVQGIAQNIIRNVNTECIFEGDETKHENGLVKVIPKFKAGAKVIGGIITIVWSDGRITQDFFRESHISNWHARSRKRFGGNGNANYTSFNGGIEPGFLQSKMLKHKLDRIGINPFPNAYKQLKPEQIADLPGADADYTDEVTDYTEYHDGEHQDTLPSATQPQQPTNDLNNLEL